MILYQKEVRVLGEHQTIKITPLTLLVFLAILLRIPSLFEPYWYGDEAIYLTVGEGVRQGLLLYRDIFDHKTPAIYLLAAAAGSLFWFKFSLLISGAVSIVLFWKLAQRLLNNNKGTLVASILYTLLTTLPLLEGNIANAELFMLTPTLGALLILTSTTPGLKKIFLAGLLFSATIMFKVPGVFDLFVPIASWVISTEKRTLKKTAGHISVLLLGSSTLIVVSLLYFAYHHALGVYINTAWSDNFNYISRWGSTLPSTPGGLIVRAGITGLILAVVWVGRKSFTPTNLFVVIWLTLALFAALLSGRPYPHYLIQIVPPICLAIAIVTSRAGVRRFLLVPFLVLTSFALVFYKFYYFPVFSYYSNFVKFALRMESREGYFKAFDRRVPQIYALSTALAGRTKSQDRVFIWGTAPEVYALSHRLPPTRFVTFFHISDFGGEKETLASLQRNKPKYIVILPEEKRVLPGFDSFLKINYLYIENIEGAQLWKLMDERLAKLLNRR